jgi:hypothetical protein
MKRFYNLISRRAACRKSPTRRLMADVLESRALMSGYSLGPLVQVSGPSFYAGSTADNLPPDQILLNSEDENQLVVDPTNPNHLVGLWHQDETAVGNRGLVVGVTFDGGSTWQLAPLPGVSQDSGGRLQSNADPWLAFAPNGDLYATCLAFTSPAQFFGTTVEDNVEVLKSTGGGLTWGAPTVLHDNTLAKSFNDKESITTDPTNPSMAYMTWTFFTVPSGFLKRSSTAHFGLTGVKAPILFTRTTDGGQTWEPVRTIYDPGANAGANGNQIVVRPDGTLLDVFDEALGAKNNDGGSKGFDRDLSVISSADEGQTWAPSGKPIRTNKLMGIPETDPDTGDPIDNNASTLIQLFDVAQDPHSGALYAVWEDARFSGGRYNGIAFSQSTDGGNSWSTPIPINQTPTNIPIGDREALIPTIAVAADGTVAVSYYDFRFNDASPGLATDYWVVFGHPTTSTSLADPANWGGELRLTDRSFDAETAAFQGGGDTGQSIFLGDYEGLKAVGNDFVATFCQAVSPSDPKSVFFRSIISTTSIAAPSVIARQMVTTSNTIPANAGPIIRSSPPDVAATFLGEPLASLDHMMPSQPPMWGKAAGTSVSLPTRNRAIVQVRRANAQAVDYLLEAGPTSERDFIRSSRKHKAVDPAGIAPSEDWLVMSMSHGDAATS